MKILESYPALTIWQPWASMIMEGWKPWEFRGWCAPTWIIGADLAIHAGARVPKRAEIGDLLWKLQRGEDSDEARGTGLTNHQHVIPFLERLHAAPAMLPIATILGVARVGRPLRNEQLAIALGLPSVNDSERGEHSNWGWPLLPLAHCRPFVPCAGHQGIWQWRPPRHGMSLTPIQPNIDRPDWPGDILVRD